MAQAAIWDSRIVGHGEEAPDQLLANPRNWRIHPKAQQDTMAAVLDQVGYVETVIVNQRSGFVVNGHMRIGLALSHGQPTVPVTYVDLSDDEEALVLSTFDRIGAQAATDQAQLDALLADVRAMPQPPTDPRLVAFLAGTAPVSIEEDEPPLDRAAELVEKWGVAPGQLWRIGPHRLLCGDSTDPEAAAWLLDGRRPDLLHVDPPYGIDIVRPKRGTAADLTGGSKPFGATSGVSRKSSTVEASARLGSVQRGPKSPNQIIQSNVYPVMYGDDAPFDPTRLLGLAPVVVLWGANYYADRLPISSCWFCWDKREDITRNSFADCELAWCSRSGPARVFHHLWNGLHKGSQHDERRTHPTEKPIALFAEIGQLYAPGGLWLDPYAGSGAQLVAAAQTGACCYAAEINPGYVAVTLERLAARGLAPVLS
jgi:DNA methylase